MAGQGGASGVFDGGLSGVAFGAGVALVSRVTQGCQPVGAQHTITAAHENVVLQLDGEPALDVLLATWSITLDQPQPAPARCDRHACAPRWCGLSEPQFRRHRRTGNFGSDVAGAPHHRAGPGARRGVAIGPAT
jgi:hypothetical protein